MSLLFRRGRRLGYLAILIETIPEIGFATTACWCRTRSPVGIENISIVKATLGYISGGRR